MEGGQKKILLEKPGDLNISGLKKLSELSNNIVANDGLSTSMQNKLGLLYTFNDKFVRLMFLRSMLFN